MGPYDLPSFQEEKRIYTVTQITQEIRELLESRFECLWVEGEVSNFRVPSSGHFYFTLKDSENQIRAVMFRSQNRLLPFRPEDGMHLYVRGRIAVYGARGEYQLILDFMEPAGIGALQMAFEQLKEKLHREGLFDPLHKVPLPFLPKRIAVVTSPTGAALRDILKVLFHRFPNMEVLVVPVRVQGEGAAQEIAQAIDEVNGLEGIDVLILARGGGSLEDLWPFNEEGVARAIFRSRIPVISAVGHEIDFTISDFVADLRAPTPSAAAEWVVQEKSTLLRDIERLKEGLKRGWDRVLLRKREEVAQAFRRLGDPRRRLSDPRLRLDDLQEDLKKAMGLFLLNLRRQLEGQAGILDSLSPLSVLKRGYAIARKLPSMEALVTASTLKRGDRIHLTLYRGEARCRVEEVDQRETPSTDGFP